MVMGYPFVYNGMASELYDASLVFIDEDYTNRPSGSEKAVVNDSDRKSTRLNSSHTS